ncbi:MAG: glyoxalase [Mucilaginibacter sp.]|nr:glyoxalase [Mucilaginibacter sp.]
MEGQGAMKKVTGLGGIFFKCNDPQKMRDWYAKNLGLNNGDHGTCFEWRHADDNAKKGFTVWSLFPGDTQYFEPSKKDFMLNYRVVNIEKLVDQLKKDGVTLIDEIRPYEYGKFVHILDPEGNSIELWEPNDEKYDKIAGARTK